MAIRTRWEVLSTYANRFEWVDVRDLAHAHTLALKTPEAGGERFIIRGGRAVWQDFGACTMITSV